MTQQSTYHKGSKNYGTGYEMMARIDAQAATIKALVEALERIANASDVYGVEANAEDQGADTLAYAHKSTCNLARAALAAAKETPHE